MTEELKACPFCGGDATDISGSRSWVACKSCGAEMPIFQTKEEGAAAWNTRAPVKVSVDRLSNIIRSEDGNHSLGAGQLAEAIARRIREALE